MRFQQDSTAVAPNGETLVPKAARAALGIVAGGAIRYVCRDTVVSVMALSQADLHDRAMAPFLALIEQGFSAGNCPAIHPLCGAAVTSLLIRPGDLDAPITGDIGL